VDWEPPQNPGRFKRIKAAYLTDADIIALADHAAALRRTTPPATPAGTAPAVA
jgi:cytochrome c553